MSVRTSVFITSIDLANMAKNNESEKSAGTSGERDLLTSKEKMKRINNLYQQICSIENLMLADDIARKGKLKQPGVIEHDKNRDLNIQTLHEMLVNKTYTTSQYTTFTIYEPKERIIFRLPYYPDRIVHHAVMNIMEPIFVSTFTADTYSCIKGRGIYAAACAVRKALKDIPGTQYCVKLDVRKFYPSVDHDVLKALLRRKIKDQDLLWLLDGIIDSAEGLPIGNYLSQYFANFYLTYFDHLMKEKLKVKYYFRYADDLVILSDNKPYLHRLLADIRAYLDEKLKLTVKDNYQVFPVDQRGIDFVGYVFYHTHVMLRKSIKKNFARMLHSNRNKKSIASYKGWALHCNSKNLLKKLLHE
jgi:RNA-directed DNA polymerase